MADFTIKQVVTFKATPHQVYELLLDSKKHSAFTGDTAKISRKVGGSFSAFSGWANGKNIELIPDKLIAQSWRAAEWPKDHYSEVLFALRATNAGTKLMFTQTGVPEQFVEAITRGWIDNYWQPMEEYLATHT